MLPPEPRYIYSNRSYWYPQAPSADYATARMRITVPAGYDAVASGTPGRPAGAGAGPGAAGRTRPQDVRLQLGPAAALSRRRDQPLQRW